jgi:hypothetical protein
MDQLVDAFSQGERRNGDEHAEGRDQRPEVGFPPVSEGVLVVGRAAAASAAPAATADEPVKTAVPTLASATPRSAPMATNTVRMLSSGIACHLLPPCCSVSATTRRRRPV